MALEWVTELGPASWLADSIRGFGRDVGSIIPSDFEAYARIFHPLEDGPSSRWSDLAARNGRVAHAEMQYDFIAAPPDQRLPPPPRHLSGMDVGSLPRAELGELGHLLSAQARADGRCWFAVWEGYGQLQGGPAVHVVSSDGGSYHPPGLVPDDVLGGPRVELPGRAYFLLGGVVADIIDLYDTLGGQSPNLWWPHDRSWCVATEIDFGWTYIGGSRQLVDHVLSSPLEALEAQLTDGVSWDSDTINTGPARPPDH